MGSKLCSYTCKSVFNDHLGSNTELCYIQNHVITNRDIKRLECIPKSGNNLKTKGGFSEGFRRHVYKDQL